MAMRTLILISLCYQLSCDHGQGFAGQGAGSPGSGSLGSAGGTSGAVSGGAKRVRRRGPAGNGEPDIPYLNDGHGHFEAQRWTEGMFQDESGKVVDGGPEGTGGFPQMFQ